VQPTFLFLRLEFVLVVWCVIAIGVLAWTFRKEGWSVDTLFMAAFFVAIGSGLYWFVPKMNIRDLDGHLGLAIRGYGFFVALGVGSAVLLSYVNARRVQVASEHVLSIAFSVLIGGFIGARLFFVIEYFDDFQKESLWETVVAILKYYEGGLVVYGGFIGGCVGFLIYTTWRKIPRLSLLDVLAPGMMIGLALGRIGCLMNGCCWGGVCTTSVAMTFPPGSPPYMRHLETGDLLDATFERSDDRGDWSVTQVTPRGRADAQGLEKGNRLVALEIASTESFQRAAINASTRKTLVRLVTFDGRELTWNYDQLPRRSRPVHPAQIYAAINALILCGILYVALPWRRRPGDVIALMLSLYPISRFLLEWIRSDEIGFAETNLTISQWMSLTLFGLAIAWWVATRLIPRIYTKSPAA